MPPSKRRSLSGRGLLSRRGLLRVGSVALVGSLAGCTSGALEKRESDRGGSTADGPKSIEFPEGPKSPPERPADLTAESAREYVRSFERRWVYNRLYRDESTEIRRECGVDSVSEDGEGFRVVVWCSAWANSGEGETTIHADYFTQYATYFVGPNETVRRDGELQRRG